MESTRRDTSGLSGNDKKARPSLKAINTSSFQRSRKGKFMYPAVGTPVPATERGVITHTLVPGTILATKAVLDATPPTWSVAAASC